MTLIACTANDFFSLSSRRVTGDGHLVARGTLARVGIQQYRRFELGLDGDPMGIVKLYRPPEEVFAPDSMRTFENVPITINHPAGNVVNASNRAAVDKGTVANIGRVGDFMDGDLTFKAKEAVDALESGKSQLSNGYTFDLDLTSGYAADHGAYDGIQRNIRGNHVALVDSARCGSACRVGDSADNNPGAPAMSTQKITVDGIPLEVSDTAAAVITNLLTKLKDAQANLTMANDSMAKMVAPDVHAKVVADLALAQKDVMTPTARDALVADWAGMLTEAKRLVPSIATDGKTCLALRREVLTTLSAGDAAVKGLVGAVLGTVAIDAATEDDVRKAFNAVAATVKTGVAAVRQTSTADAAIAAALNGGVVAVTAVDGKVPELTGRDKRMADSANAWKQ